jgi:hypothetical protein
MAATLTVSWSFLPVIPQVEQAHARQQAQALDEFYIRADNGESWCHWAQ